MKKLFAVLLAAALSPAAVAGVKGTLLDNYTGARLDSHGTWIESTTDSMGGVDYDLRSLSYDYDKASHRMKVTVDAGNYRDGNGGTELGDLFLHFNLNPLLEVSPSGKDRSDLSATDFGVDWNDGLGFVFDTSSKKIFGGNFGMQYAAPLSGGGVPLPGGSKWTGDGGRNGQEVGYSSGGSVVASGNSGSGKYDPSLGFVDNGHGTLTYTFDLQKLSTAAGFGDLDSKLSAGMLDLSARWTMTCANDVLQGRFSIPEPSALLMLGLGLTAMAGLRRRA